MRRRLRALGRNSRLLRPIYDAQFLIRRCHARTGAWPNLVVPRTFNDWILRRLILERDPLHARLSDKLALRGFVEERLGEQLCVPLLGVWADAAALARDWDSLPDSFLLKPSHASGLVRAVPCRATADRTQILVEATRWLAVNYHDLWCEWGYRDVPGRLLAEPLLPSPPGEPAPYDYRLYVFGGRVGLLRINAGRGAVVTSDTFDGALRRVPVCFNHRPVVLLEPPGPGEWRRMVELAGMLCRGVDFLRCDFYLIDGRILVGEVTSFPSAGCAPIEPAAWNVWLGGMWRAARTGRPWPDPPA